MHISNRGGTLSAVMAEEDHLQLVSKFLPKLVKEANERGVVCGNHKIPKWYISTGKDGIEMSYVFPKTKTSRIEMRIYHGKEKEDVDSAYSAFKHYLSKRSEIELAYGGPLNWNEGTRTAFYIRQDYHDFQLSDVSRWEYWIEKIVTDMNKLDDALRPHHSNSRN